MTANNRPLVLCFSGHDPTGGAGIQADIEAIAANGGHALTVITTHTVQDTANVQRVSAVAPILMAAQVDALLADCQVAAIKVGLLGDAQQIPLILSAERQTGSKLVLDPVLRGGGGAALCSAALVAALRADLLPAATVLTPNAAESRQLAPGLPDLDACGRALVAAGARNVLITGGDEPGDVVVNSWQCAKRPPWRYAWPRLPQSFHGAGCTLASAIAALLARGLPISQALEDAQAYTHRTLLNALSIGKGRPIPNRVRRET